MKKFLVIVLLVCAAKFLFDKNKSFAIQTLNPAVIEKPVYAQVRLQLEVPGRAIDQLVLVETVDAGDCQRQTEDVVAGLLSGEPGLKVQSKTCVEQLEPRFRKLFDRKPAALTYVSVARGAPEEREARIVYWGVTVEESDRVCGIVENLKVAHKGEVSCVRAAR